jgi:hypothetical protein
MIQEGQICMPCSCQWTTIDKSAWTVHLLHYAKHSFNALKVQSGPNLVVLKACAIVLCEEARCDMDWHVSNLQEGK